MAHGAIAPRASDSRSSGTTSSGSKNSLVPSPSQAGQAPCGVLKENSRGSISAMVKPETGQANCDEKMRALAAIGVLGDDDAVGQVERGLEESASRLPMPSRTTMRSTTTSMSCLSFLSSAGRLVDLVQLAVDLHALEAAPLQFGQLLAVFALAAAHHRREQQQPRALRHRQDAVDHLRHGLASIGRPVAGE